MIFNLAQRESISNPLILLRPSNQSVKASLNSSLIEQAFSLAKKTSARQMFCFQSNKNFSKNEFESPFHNGDKKKKAPTLAYRSSHFEKPKI